MENLKAYISYFENDICTLEIKGTEDSITSIVFVDKKENLENTNNVIEECKNQLSEYFKGTLKEFTINMEYINGTEFQKSVWEALRKIPYGKTASYKDIAISVGNEKAARAVGMANNKNPMMIIVPCHRVISADGKLTGYVAGIEVKEKLLKLEGCI